MGVEAIVDDFERVYTTHWVDVFRFALAWTNDWGTAEDLAQDAFAQLWRHRAQLDWTQPMVPWLIRVTRNAATDRFRLLRRLLSPQSNAVSSQDNLSETWMDVVSAMSRLTQLERTALLSTAVLGFSAGECGAILRISDGAVRAASSRARRKLEAER